MDKLYSEDFEKWAEGVGHDIKRNDSGVCPSFDYLSRNTNWAWEAWKAALSNKE